MVPYAETFWNGKDAGIVMTVYDEQTGDVLARKRGIEVDTKKFTIEADVSGVEYVRIEFNANNPGFGGKMLVKDACLY